MYLKVSVALTMVTWLRWYLLDFILVKLSFLKKEDLCIVTERNTHIFHLLLHFPNDHDGLDWAMLKPRTRNSYESGRGPSP